MALNHRKLFPGETNTNQTQDCYGFCDPSCPYNCYSNPDYYYTPPPPSILTSENSNQVNHISTYLIILVCLFTIIFIVVGFYVIKVKCYDTWCGWRVNNSVPSQTDNSEEFLNENQVDHPVWLIATVGLQQSMINSITVCKYRRDEGLIEGTECSVCLNEFREDETLRLLPKCNHAFHIPCIDTWLRSHTNCPLCRAGIVSNNVPPPEAVVSSLATLGRENTNFGRNQETQMENSRNDGGLSNNRIVNGDLENRAGTGESSEALQFTDESNSKERVINDPIQNQGVVNDEIQTEIGSASVDPRLAGGGDCLDPGEVNSCSIEPECHHHVVDHTQDETELHKGNTQDDDYSKTCKIMRRSSIEQCLHISPVTMKRSFSWNGRILSTKGYMSLNSTLPY